MKPPTREMFSQGTPATVIKQIAVFAPGRIRWQGRDYPARLHELICHATLRMGQPVLIIGRENITMIVIPMHCILWEQYLTDDFGLFLNDSDVQQIQRYENF
ncbi:MAG: hypothetical protein IGS54_07280 [Elainella sp. C42_A2020_010]|nr:hypothetical protein [Elainella sp. C42_A2020_010]